jgi:hypothetical protein
MYPEFERIARADDPAEGDPDSADFEPIESFAHEIFA